VTIPEDDWIRLGSIVGVHGVQGWLKIFSDTSPPEQILTYQPWQAGRLRPEHLLEVAASRVSGKKIQVSLKSIQDRSQAEQLVGYGIWTTKAVLPELASGEFYWHQLLGLAVINEQAEILGTVLRLMETGANDVLVVAATPDSLDDRERLIPFVEPEIIKSIDLAARTIRVDWLAAF